MFIDNKLELFDTYRVIWFRHGSLFREREKVLSSRPPEKSAYLKIIFLYLNQNMCCGYSKETSQWDGSFEYPKHMFNL